MVVVGRTKSSHGPMFVGLYFDTQRLTLTPESCKDRARPIPKLKQMTDQRLLRLKETLLEHMCV